MEKTTTTRKFLIATHGTFAAGVKSSLDLIIGAMDNVFLIQAYVDENKSIESEINEIMAQVGENDELVVLADILGGSVTNMLLQHALRPNVHIVSGFNLPLAIEILMADATEPIEEVISQAIDNAKEQMVYVNKLLSTQNTTDDND
jgi:fructoselysine and glucoselysine-specific PTS system IIA component